MNLTFDWGGPELIDSKMFYAPDSICSVRAFEVQGHLKIEKKIIGANISRSKDKINNCLIIFLQNATLRQHH